MLLSVLYTLLFAITFYYSFKMCANTYVKRGVMQIEVFIASLGWAAIIVLFYN